VCLVEYEALSSNPSTVKKGERKGGREGGKERQRKKGRKEGKKEEGRREGGKEGGREGGREEERLTESTVRCWENRGLSNGAQYTTSGARKKTQACLAPGPFGCLLEPRPVIQDTL
jgi:hypothetical protein